MRKIIITVIALTFLLPASFVGAAEEAIKLKDGSELVYISTGEFEMGNNRFTETRPVHKVKSSAFYLGKYEITNRQYKRFCDETKREYPNKKWFGIGDDWVEYLDSPVLFVSWKDAYDYAKWAGGRLPTEAEWEYACKAGTATTYYWGNDLSHDHINYKGKTKLEKDVWQLESPVGSFDPNPFGLYDMLGNAAEWVADWYVEDYYKKSTKIDPKGPKKGIYRVVKGGHWADGGNLGCFVKDWRDPGQGNKFRGFRIAADAK